MLAMAERSSILERRRTQSLGLKAEKNQKQSSTKRRLRRKGSNLVYLVLCAFFLLSSSLLSWKDIEISTYGSGVCDGYKGTLHISQGDNEGAAGTIFFLFVLNQLLYAEKHSLIPWIHMNNVSHYVYDPIVHGKGNPITFEVQSLVNASWTSFVDSISKQKVAFAGPPSFPKIQRKTKVTVTGNGIWDSYFYPVSAFKPTDVSCQNLPMVRLSHRQIIPALHVSCPWSVRAWRYGGLPPSIRKDNLSYEDWFTPMRERGSALVKNHIRFLPYLHRLAETANPFTECLALHIRHSDKANRRRKIPVQRFLPYVQAYMEEKQKVGKDKNFAIYLATDSHHVLTKINEEWPSEILDQLQWQKQAVRSNDTTPVFTLSPHHTTNNEVLVDIIAMSKCQYLLHGFSAVSEAAHYLNRNLYKKRRSINLELQNRPSVDHFRALVHAEK